MIIEICVGSSCHLKGSPEIVALLQKNIEEARLEDEITLAGSFCKGVCNREGVTVIVDDVVHIGVTTENFDEFWKTKVLEVLESERK